MTQENTTVIRAFSRQMQPMFAITFGPPDGTSVTSGRNADLMLQNTLTTTAAKLNEVADRGMQ
jgi:hypothetical protein